MSNAQVKAKHRNQAILTVHPAGVGNLRNLMPSKCSNSEPQPKIVAQGI